MEVFFLQVVQVPVEFSLNKFVKRT